MSIATLISKKTPFFYGWVILGSAGSTQIVRNAAASLTLAIFMYPMAEDLGWSRTVIAGAASVGGLAATLFSPFMGWAVDKFGSRAILTSSVLILGISSIISGWATIPLVFYISYGTGRVILSSSIQISSSVVVSRWFIKLRGRANGVLTFCHSIGMTSFPLLASILIGLYGWQTTWKIFGFLVWGIALIPVAILIRETPESMGLKPDDDIAQTNEQNVEASPEINWSIGQAIKTFSLWQLALSGGLFYIVHGGVNNHMAALLQDYGLSANQAAIAISINAIFTGLGGLMWGWITDKLSMRLCYLILSVLMGISSIGFILVSGIVSAWITAAIFGISLGGLLVVPSVAIANYYGRNSLGTIRGFIEPFGSAGTAIGAILSGIIFDLTGVYEIALILLAIAAALAFILMISSKPPSLSQNISLKKFN